MKQNMKRMLLVLCMAVCFFALSACGSASEEAVEPISPEIEQTMSDGAKSYLEQFASYSDEDLAAQLKQAEKQKNTVIESAISSWTSSKDDLGKMGEIQSVTVERADDDSYTAVVQASFEKRNLTFSLTAEESVSSYGGTSLVPTELSFVVNYSFGEKMEKAALNTLMGMGTVFLVLIFISLLISCFKFIGLIGKGKADKSPVAVAAAPAAPVLPASAPVQRPAAPAPAPVAAAPAPAPAPAAAPAPKAAAPAGATTVEAPMPGKILNIKVSEGQAVKFGEVVVIMEAMKMETEIVAPADGTVSKILVKAGDSVDTGAALVALN